MNKKLLFTLFFLSVTYLQSSTLYASQTTITQECADTLKAEIESVRAEFENIRASREAQNKLLEEAQNLNKQCLQLCKEMGGTNKHLVDLLITTKGTLDHWKTGFAVLASVTITSVFANVMLGCCLSHHHEKADGTCLNTPAAPQEKSC